MGGSRTHHKIRLEERYGGKVLSPAAKYSRGQWILTSLVCCFFLLFFFSFFFLFLIVFSFFLLGSPHIIGKMYYVYFDASIIGSMVCDPTHELRHHSTSSLYLLFTYLLSYRTCRTFVLASSMRPRTSGHALVSCTWSMVQLQVSSLPLH